MHAHTQSGVLCRCRTPHPSLFAPDEGFSRSVRVSMRVYVFVGFSPHLKSVSVLWIVWLPAGWLAGWLTCLFGLWPMCLASSFVCEYALEIALLCACRR